MNATPEIREAIAGALHPVLGDPVRDGSAEVSSYGLPGLPDGVAWRVLINDFDHPQQTYVGLWPDGSAKTLPEDEQAFHDLVAAAGAEIDSDETALAFVLAFLELTRGPTAIVRPLEAAADIRWRPGTDEQERRRAAFLAESPIRPPAARATAKGFRVEVWLVVDQRIQRNTFEVSKDGKIESSFRIAAADLPLPIAL